MRHKSNIRIFPFVIIGLILTLSNSCKKEDKNSITDIDGNAYRKVTIGTQIWMGENLKTTRYNDGTEIQLVTDSSTWVHLYTGGYCWYNYDAATYGKTYGALYNLPAVNSGKLAPKGWHVATEDEWKILINYLGGELQAGSRLKEADTVHWMSPNYADNNSGFTALPGGYGHGGFWAVGYNGDWWSYTDGNNMNGSTKFELGFSNSFVHKDEFCQMTWGCSVRCVKDN